MSSYHAVVPVSWARLTEVVVPAWIDTLVGRRTVASFAEQLAPGEVQDVLDWYQGPDYYPQPLPSWPVSPRLLDDIGWAPGMAFVAADRLRASALHAELNRDGRGEFGTVALAIAIRLSASVELAGVDRFENHSLPHEAIFDREFFRFYGHFLDAPRCQVAGTKNRYRFLDHVFASTWQKDRHLYACEARPSVDPALRALLEALFLSTRAFPGTWILDRDATWPASDEPRIVGLLAPGEVRQLVPHLDTIARLEADRPVDKQDELFPLFDDRVRRAADQGLGLVTLFAEL